jgi:hypothetical protein
VDVLFESVGWIVSSLLVEAVVATTSIYSPYGVVRYFQTLADVAEEVEASVIGSTQRFDLASLFLEWSPVLGQSGKHRRCFGIVCTKRHTSISLVLS